MPYYHIYLRTYERRFRFAPPVYSLALFNGLPMQYQKMDRLEFTYRLSTGIPQISLRVNGRSLELPAPHLLIKRPGDEIEHPAPAERNHSGSVIRKKPWSCSVQAGCRTG